MVVYETGSLVALQLEFVRMRKADNMVWIFIAEIRYGKGTSVLKTSHVDTFHPLAFGHL